MKHPTLVVDYSDLSDPKYLAKSGLIFESAYGTDIYGTIPETCSKEVYQAAFNSYKEAYQLGSNGDRGWIAERKKRREVLDKIIYALGLHIQLVSAGDLNMLLKSGFDVRMPKTGNGRSRQPIPAPA